MLPFPSPTCHPYVHSARNTCCSKHGLLEGNIVSASVRSDSESCYTAAWFVPACCFSLFSCFLSPWPEEEGAVVVEGEEAAGGGGRYAAPSGRYSGYTPAVARSYSGGRGRSTSSSGFGLGLGAGLGLGYGITPVRGYGGYGYGHNYGQYSRGTAYSRTRPLTCYNASLVAEIKEDLAIEENLVTCNSTADVCFGKVVLTVSNTSSTTNTSRGIVQVLKGCANKTELAKSFNTTQYNFSTSRLCYVSKIQNSSRVLLDLSGLAANTSVLSNQTSPNTNSSSQEEFCYCEGSQCNPAAHSGVNTQLILLSAFLAARIAFA